MVFRKPYAFLIKNFRKIHIALLLLCVYIYFKINGILSFVSDYINYGAYSQSLEPFSSKTGVLFYIAILSMIIVSFMLLILLKRKNKPWKVYLLYIGEYVLLLSGVIFISGYFSNYSNLTSVSGVLAYRDMLNISKLLQFPIFFLLIIRVLGIDLKKFNFKSDEEYLELSSEDREEFEISFDFDKNSIKRGFNRFKRNMNYFYHEHKFVCNSLFTILIVFSIGYSYYYFGIVHKSYKQGQSFSSGIYNITVLDSYVTNKDLAGNKIEKGNKFVIIKINVKNNYNKEVEPNLNRYHLVNRNTDRTYNIYYNSYFTDIGIPADSKINISGGKSKTFYLAYRVKENLSNKKFVLYYQELGGKLISYLRKIKLNLEDISNIEDAGTYNVNDKITFTYISKTKKIITPTRVQIGSGFDYNRYYCPSDGVCSVFTNHIDVYSDKLLLKISFASSDFEGEDFIDFSSKYGKIKYIDNNGKIAYYSVKDAIKMSYQGKEIFIEAPSEVLSSKNIWIEYTLRNKRYTLNIK